MNKIYKPAYTRKVANKMSYNLYSGYTGLIAPPFESLDRYGCAMYCVTTSSKRTLLAIPLTPHFFNDLYNIVKHPQYQKLILVVPSTDCIWISGIYNIYCEVTANLKKKFELVCPHPVTIPTSDKFLTHIVHGNHVVVTLTGLNETKERFVGTIDFTHTVSSPARDIDDILLSMADKRIYFSMYTNPEKIKWLEQSRHWFTELHMAFANNLYGGYDLLPLLKEVGVDKLETLQIKANQFRTKEEIEYCRLHDIEHGMVVYRDFV